VPELRFPSHKRIAIRTCQRRRQLELLRTDPATDLLGDAFSLRRRPDAQRGEHARAERRVRGQCSGGLARLGETAEQCAVDLLREWIELGLLSRELERTSPFAVLLSLVGGGREQLDAAATLLVARFDCPLVVDPGEELAFAAVEKLGVAGVDPDRVAVREADAFSRGDQGRLRSGPEHPPDRPDGVAEARARAGIHDVGPEAACDSRPWVQPGMECQPGEELCGAPGR